MGGHRWTVSEIFKLTLKFEMYDRSRAARRATATSGDLVLYSQLGLTALHSPGSTKYQMKNAHELW